MKKLFTFLALAVTCSLVASQEPQYFKGSWQEALDKAKKENKYIVLDCYTDWCYWCKVMDKKTFTDSAVVAELNQHFILVKREMEKTDEGLKLSMKYHVNAFPTFLYFSPQGNLVSHNPGYVDAASYLNHLQAIRRGQKYTDFKGLSAQLEPGYPDFYKASFGEGKKRKFADKETVASWLDQQQDLYSEVCFSVMWRFELTSKYTNWFMKNSAKLGELYGQEMVDDKIAGILYNQVMTAAKTANDSLFKDAIAKTERQFKRPDVDYMLISFSISYYEKTEKWTALADFMQSKLDTAAKGSLNGQMNEVAWNMYEHCKDDAVLKRATVWMKEVTETEPSYAYLDTYAALLYKTGNYKDAESVALKAIETGKKEGENVSSTESLLANIRLKLK